MRKKGRALYFSMLQDGRLIQCPMAWSSTESDRVRFAEGVGWGSRIALCTLNDATHFREVRVLVDRWNEHLR